jgi:hypothetical protein
VRQAPRSLAAARSITWPDDHYCFVLLILP